MITLFGSYVHPEIRTVWSGGLVKLLGELGFSVGAARVALMDGNGRTRILLQVPSDGSPSLSFLDSNGKAIRKFTARAPRPQATPAPGAAQVQTPPEQQQVPSGEESAFFGGAAAPRVSTDVGLNRFIWDLRYGEAVRFPGMILWAGETRGPKIVPGSYQVKLTVDGKTMIVNFEVKSDPRLTTTAPDYARQLDLALKIRDKLNETHNAIIEIRDVRKEVGDVRKEVGDLRKDMPGIVGNTMREVLRESAGQSPKK